MKSPTAKQVKAARTAAGLTQRQFAEKLGYSVEAVRSWEQGWRKCRMSVLNGFKP